MKKLFLSLIVALTSVTGLMAQSITVAEPEFAEETLLLTSDSQGVTLSRENGTIKTKAGASLYLTGIGKVKSRLTLKGIKSTSKAVGGSTTRLIIKAADNKTDPNSFISTTLHSIDTGLSFISGHFTNFPFSLVSFISLNLSTSLPERTPQ